MPRSDRGGDGAGNELFASNEPLLELPAISNLPRKPKMNSGDRACLLVFCMVGLSMCFVGPAVMFTDNQSTTPSTLFTSNDSHHATENDSSLNLTWYAWQDPLDETMRPSMNAAHISDFPPFPNYLYTFYSHALSALQPNPRLSLHSEAHDPLLLVIKAGEVTVVPTVRVGVSTVEAQLNGSTPSTLVLATRNEQVGLLSNVDLDGISMVDWTCTPGLMGEQYLVFEPTRLHTVPWTAATDDLGPFTWLHATFRGAGAPASRTLRIQPHGLVTGYVYLNGVLLGRYNSSSAAHFAVDVFEENTITVLEEISASNVRAVQVHLD